MTTASRIDRVLRAYRPLYLRGTLVENQPHLPPPRRSAAARPRLLLLALVAVLRRGRP
ncbi:hypothetical protein [Fulvimonas soli]|jgi:hypothetical protein|uniref:Uncharacterized protein n=1 Tax=Fulvimonas soli TaxID=155197 RepID=A0A316II58_9GAMM|nr:hypothetical protein [Fulvimonas soli]PWK92560.1 hypothetical protein C7456_102295 [Fulvimonas soli]